MILQRFFFILSVFVHSIFVSYGQDKPPVAVDDTVLFPVTTGPIMSFMIYPLSNDFSQDMHPIKVASVVSGSAGSTAIAKDSTIEIIDLFLEENYTITYRIKDKVNDLLSEPANIYLIAKNQSFDMLNINNINARINATSYHFCSYINSQMNDYFECPKFSNNHTFSNFKLWIAGLDESGDLHLTPPRHNLYGLGYHQYRSGPISCQYDSTFKDTWERVWTLYYADIETHKNHFSDPGYEIPEPLLNWPGNGDTTIGQAWKLAPFKDLDEDGLYEPLDGDYPIIKGDQAIYFISNDDRGEYAADSLYFGIEIHGMAYAYDCPDDSIFQNTMFIDYKLINRSPHQYHDVYVGVKSNLGIGSPKDDYTACDTLLDAFFAYNADNYDAGINEPGYGYFPPAQAVSFLNQSLSHFITYFKYWLVISYPSHPWDYYNSLQGKWNDESSITFGGIGYGGSQACDFQFPGDPTNPYAWSMYTASVDPEHHYFPVGSTGPFVMNPGDTIPLELAILFARDYGGDNLSSVTLLKERLKKLRAYYFTDSIPCNTILGTEDVRNKMDRHILIYPNPAKEHFHIELSSPEEINMDFELISITGSTLIQGKQGLKRGVNTITINCQNLPADLYILKLGFEESIIYRKVIIQ